jgi:hypothetical protein
MLLRRSSLGRPPPLLTTSARLLGQLADSGRPISHGLLDELPQTQSPRWSIDAVRERLVDKFN